jgi:predicted RNA binding protein YcfA (HicA-like mRNA interferase family)
MPKLPVVSGQEALKRFERFGYTFVRQVGSHMRLIHHSDSSREPLSIPDHRELRKGILRRLLRDAKITVEEFENLR